ncbi:MAG TPA: hypothetical protein VEU31_03615 [Candidatus Acidoferrales bacterium]|nr:hypothetical protein [Candidatus Acidoferrales bacterium]
MLPFVEIPVLLFLIALQFSAWRRVSHFWVGVRYVLTASALVALPFLLYLGVIIEQPHRAISAGGVKSVAVGPFFYPAPVLRRSKDMALGAAVLIAVCGLMAAFVKQTPARLLKLLEIFTWLAAVVVASALTLLLILFARSGFNH